MQTLLPTAQELIVLNHRLGGTRYDVERLDRALRHTLDHALTLPCTAEELARILTDALAVAAPFAYENDQTAAMAGLQLRIRARERF